MGCFYYSASMVIFVTDSSFLCTDYSIFYIVAYWPMAITSGFETCSTTEKKIDVSEKWLQLLFALFSSQRGYLSIVMKQIRSEKILLYFWRLQWHIKKSYYTYSSSYFLKHIGNKFELVHICESVCVSLPTKKI